MHRRLLHSNKQGWISKYWNEIGEVKGRNSRAAIIRSLVLYPAELRVRIDLFAFCWAAVEYSNFIQSWNSNIARMQARH